MLTVCCQVSPKFKVENSYFVRFSNDLESFHCRTRRTMQMVFPMKNLRNHGADVASNVLKTKHESIRVEFLAFNRMQDRSRVVNFSFPFFFF